MQTTIVLGKGYVGKNFCSTYPKAFSTIRKLGLSKNEFYFDLYDKNSWKNLPDVKNVLWTFPVAIKSYEVQHALDFYDYYCTNKNTIILSSTSAFLVENPDQDVDENTPINLDNIRFHTEEELRKKGACLFYLAGIFGPERSPLNWYLNQRVQDPNKYLNLIHVHDIVTSVGFGFNNFESGETYIVSNGYPQRNRDIVKKLIEHNELPKDYKFPNTTNQSPSKRLVNHKLISKILPQTYKFINYP